MLGVGVTAGLYAAIISGPLNNPILRRFCLSHWTSAAAICMAMVALSLIVIKVWNALTQLRLTNATVQALDRLVTEGCDVFPAERPRWLEASWLSMPAEWQSSWFWPSTQSHSRSTTQARSPRRARARSTIALQSRSAATEEQLHVAENDGLLTAYRRTARHGSSVLRIGQLKSRWPTTLWQTARWQAHSRNLQPSQL